ELTIDGDAQLVTDGEDLSRKGLVELDDVDVGDFPSRRRQHLSYRLDGTDAHDLGSEPGDRAGDDAGQGRQPQGAGLVLAHHQDGGGAVVERAGVAGRDLAVGLER